ncbi:monocarboxylate permease [Amylocystis lapponica]|nr:monocarboxylate permease [Amylocystis lapponica]
MPSLDHDSEKRDAFVLDSQPVSEHPTIEPSSPELDFPEGGLEAWTVVAGSFLAFFATFGVSNAYGVFQDYYQTTLLTDSSDSTISLIGAIQLFLLYGAGSVIGKLYDAYGTRVLLPLGTFCTVFSLMMVSLVQPNQPYQLFLAQGILFGIGISLIFNPSLAIVGHWFKRKRGYAIGVVASGSSFGGVVFPIMLQRLIPRIGFPWAVRAVAFTCLGLLTISCILIKPRLPFTGKVHLTGLIDLDGFKQWNYLLVAIGSFLIFYSMFIPYFYLQPYADFEGVSNNISIYLLALINAAGIPSRIVPGILADRWGCLTVLVPSTLLAGIFVLALWLPARDTGGVIAFALMYGLFTGAFVSLLPTYVYSISPMNKSGARLGSVYLVVSVAVLVGTPTAGGFVKVESQASYRNLIVFTGVLVLAGAALLGASGFLSRLFTRRRAQEDVKA